MSIARTMRRQAKLRIEKENGRITCPKCHDKLVEKPGYGQVCQKCGWEKEERGKEPQ